MTWDLIVEEIKPYIAKIETPTASGTGFLCLYNSNKQWCGVATALHVVSYADYWQQPIRIILQNIPQQIILYPKDRVVFTDFSKDSAIIFFDRSNIKELPEELIKLHAVDQPLKIGSEVGWVGFPYLEPYTLCFFSGCISARREYMKAYLIDGVSINGVSGGPVIYDSDSNGMEIIGIVSAYEANKATGATLPGLLIAQDIAHLHDVVKQIKSYDEAVEKKQQMEEEKAKMEKETIQTKDAEPTMFEKRMM